MKRGERGNGKMEERTRADGPAMRLMRLWLWAAPLGMLALAVLFGVLAVAEGMWRLLSAMVLLALVAVGLCMVQWRLLKRLREMDR